ncbi:MAG TPA: 2-amino-4-hydroxy-6-hydroxymethyldihydropteridine diphosphokinase [Polyangia bacterium]|nr:2-amino-4-hydroxy-6-hydroxymethyldihydropteridine diphosphokinase [Polyangia bacterium]
MDTTRFQEEGPGGERVFIGLGSNLGDRALQIERALDWLRGHSAIKLVGHTGCIETEPWGVTDQPHFLNAVAEIRTVLGPEALLAELQAAEVALGRVKEGRSRWSPREIDLDILLFGERIVETIGLTIPHPGLTERRFVLTQLLELGPDLQHPLRRLPLEGFLV